MTRRQAFCAGALSAGVAGAVLRKVNQGRVHAYSSRASRVIHASRWLVLAMSPSVITVRARVVHHACTVLVPRAVPGVCAGLACCLHADRGCTKGKAPHIGRASGVTRIRGLLALCWRSVRPAAARYLPRVGTWPAACIALARASTSSTAACALATAALSCASAAAALSHHDLHSG